MRKRLGILAVTLACLAGGPALAEDSGAAQPAVPNIVGTWTGQFKLLHATGPAEQKLIFRVLTQDGPLITAEKDWHIVGGTAGDVNGKKRTHAVEHMVGVIDFDGTIHLAEEGDSGLYTGRFVAPDKLQLVYIEAGDLATAYRAELTKEK